MRTRLAIFVLTLAIPAFCSAQLRASRYLPTADPTATRMFGSRPLGTSLSAGSRSLARGVPSPSAAQVGSGVPQRLDPRVGVVPSTQRFVPDVRPIGSFVGADPADVSVPGDVVVSPALPTAPAGPIPAVVTSPPVATRIDANQVNASGVAATPPNPPAPSRVARTLAYEGEPVPPQFESQLVARIKSRPAFQALGPIQAIVQNRTLVLRGTVATAHDRNLAARLALLEAGVDDVQNELVVNPPVR